MILKISFLSCTVSKGVYAIDTYIENILACASNAYIKGICAKNNWGKDVYIESAYIKVFCSKIIYIGDTSVGDTCSWDACIGTTFIKKSYVKSACVKSSFGWCAYVMSICAGSACAIEHLRIHLQFFQISEVKLFGTELETGARVG